MFATVFVDAVASYERATVVSVEETVVPVFNARVTLAGASEPEVVQVTVFVTAVPGEPLEANGVRVTVVTPATAELNVSVAVSDRTARLLPLIEKLPEATVPVKVSPLRIIEAVWAVRPTAEPTPVIATRVVVAVSMTKFSSAFPPTT
jgi:hypothetical protein